MALIRLEHVSVDYMLRKKGRQSIANAVQAVSIGGALRQAHGQFGVAALKNVSLQVKNRQRIGLIGPNGAGKSTLLKVMAGILPPTEGKVRVEGRVSSLLSIRLGVNNDLSGYENIYARARLMGHSETEIASHVDDIVEFSELGDYLHLPVRTYSSGMSLRLMFAIATAFEPDILILDEWLSAGDAGFRKKATQRLRSLIRRTRIVVFASHNARMLEEVCNVGIVLNRGKVTFLGPITTALDIAEIRKNMPGQRKVRNANNKPQAAVTSEKSSTNKDADWSNGNQSDT